MLCPVALALRAKTRSSSTPRMSEVHEGASPRPSGLLTWGGRSSRARLGFAQARGPTPQGSPRSYECFGAFGGLLRILEGGPHRGGLRVSSDLPREVRRNPQGGIPETSSHRGLTQTGGPGGPDASRATDTAGKGCSETFRSETPGVEADQDSQGLDSETEGSSRNLVGA